MTQDLTSALKERFYDLPVDLFCIVNLDDYKILHASSAFEHILGWKPEEIVGNTIDHFVNSFEDKASIEKAFSKIALGIHSMHFETEFQCKNAQVRWIDWKGYVDPENPHIFMIGRDITPYKEAQKALSSQAHIDPLTGAFNRQMFMAVLQKEIDGAIRYHYPTSLILLDIDHFREYNDRHGLQRGDQCLRQMAITLKNCLRRKTDFLARFENDQFAVLLTHNDLEKAAKSAEYLRLNIEKMLFKASDEEQPHAITISLGVASIPETTTQALTSDQVLNAATNALNLSRQNGGDRVHCTEAFGIS